MAGGRYLTSHITNEPNVFRTLRVLNKAGKHRKPLASRHKVERCGINRGQRTALTFGLCGRTSGRVVRVLLDGKHINLHIYGVPSVLSLGKHRQSTGISRCACCVLFAHKAKDASQSTTSHTPTHTQHTHTRTPPYTHIHSCSAAGSIGCTQGISSAKPGPQQSARP